jgi:hypothetical protein
VIGNSEFIARAKLIHGDKYDYSLVNYINIRSKIKIICKLHGEFEQLPCNHLRGSGCPECSNNMQLNTISFIDKAKQVHGDKYDYSLVNYKGCFNKVKIICKIHGEFEQSSTHHLRGCNCPKCSNNMQLNTISFIDKAKQVHGDKYDYSLVNYKGCFNKIKIICKLHGEFEQIAGNHLKGCNCPKCNSKTLTTNEFIIKAKQVHGDRYNYSLVDYINSKKKVKIICKIHGEFEQVPYDHLQGYGCLKCCHDKNKSNTIDFINKVKKVHGDKYDYSLVNYINSSIKVKIICKLHGIFEQLPNNHLSAGNGCPKCPSLISKQQQEIIDYLLSLNIKFNINDRNTIKPYELDIYIPDKKLAIEYNGIYWHSDKFIDKYYHYEKALICFKKGIKLIQIFEDEWLFRNKIIKSIINTELNIGLIVNNNYIIKELNNIEFNNFYKENSFNYTNCEIMIGLIYENNLVCAAGFNKHNIYDYECFFCNKLNVISCINKLLEYFIKKYQPNSILSSIDGKYLNYNQLFQFGFKLIDITDPKCYDVKGKHIISNINMINNGYRHIFDAGHWNFVWLKQI